MWTRVATRKQSCNCAQVAPCSFPVGSSLAKLTAWAVCHFSDFLQILALLPPFCITPLQMPFYNSSEPYAQFPAKIASSHANIQLISAKSDQIRVTKTSLSNFLSQPQQRAKFYPFRNNMICKNQALIKFNLKTMHASRCV